jgi:phosphoribosylformylglycinamidine synthase
VQVGDPFEEKRLIEACLALLDAGLVVGIQDLGGAGLCCATSETASRGGVGMDVDVSAVARREPGMAPLEIMTSESQERMLAIVEPDDLDEVLAICERWDVSARVVGTVTEGGTLRVLEGGTVVGEVPAASLHEDAPLYERPLAPPDRSGERDPSTLHPPVDTADDLLVMLADTSWIWQQYDHQLFLSTVVGPGTDAAVLRLKHPVTGLDTGRGLALTTDGNHRWCAVSPRAGTARVVAEAVVNLACAGARPVALVNCLNLGNPEHPEVMWQLAQAVDGMADACRAFGIPVVGGNVSLYNETRGHDIDPTPVVGLLGIVDRLVRRPPGPALRDGSTVLVLGAADTATLAGSRWAWGRGAKGGALPAPDLDAVGRLASLVRELVDATLLAGVHDVADGGVALALAEMVAAGDVGLRAPKVDDHRLLFAESAGRVVVCVASADVDAVRSRAQAARVPVDVLGVAGGDRLVLGRLVDLTVADIASAWRDRLPVAFGTATTH